MNNMFFVGDKVEILDSWRDKQHIGKVGIILEEKYLLNGETTQRMLKDYVVEFKDGSKGTFAATQMMIL